jgi:hypothetical protein
MSAKFKPKQIVKVISLKRQEAKILEVKGHADPAKPARYLISFDGQHNKKERAWCAESDLLPSKSAAPVVEEITEEDDAKVNEAFPPKQENLEELERKRAEVLRKLDEEFADDDELEKLTAPAGVK